MATKVNSLHDDMPFVIWCFALWSCFLVNQIFENALFFVLCRQHHVHHVVNFAPHWAYDALALIIVPTHQDYFYRLIFSCRAELVYPLMFLRQTSSCAWSLLASAIPAATGLTMSSIDPGDAPCTVAHKGAFVLLYRHPAIFCVWPVSLATVVKTFFRV